MALNKRKSTRTPRKATVNHEGGVSYSLNDPFTRLRISATSCFFGEPAFYVAGEGKPAQTRSYTPGYNYAGGGRYVEREGFGTPLITSVVGKNTRQVMEEAIDACLAVDIERTLQFAVELRNAWFMRATPQVIMVRAACHPNVEDTGLIGLYAGQIMTRLDEVMNQMAYFESFKGSLKNIPSRLKRAWAARLSQAKEYELAKYKLASKEVNLFDAVRLTHANSDAINKLMKGGVSLANEETQTWESIRSGGGSWKDALKVMGHMALLRNLRNLHKDGEISTSVLEKLKSGVESGKQLPFRYYSAYKAIGERSGAIADALEECLEMSLRFSIPRFKGRGLTICDVSGSMDGGRVSENSDMTYKEIAVLMSAITNRCFEDGGDTLLFASNTEWAETRRKTSIFTEMASLINKGNFLGGGTDIIRALKTLNASHKKYDTIFLYSDMQCGYETSVPSQINAYRRDVNPNVQVFFVNLAGYQDALVPEFFNKTYLIGGWTDKMLQFADKLIGITSTLQ